MYLESVSIMFQLSILLFKTAINSSLYLQEISSLIPSEQINIKPEEFSLKHTLQIYRQARF